MYKISCGMELCWDHVTAVYIGRGSCRGQCKGIVPDSGNKGDLLYGGRSLFQAPEPFGSCWGWTKAAL